MKNFIPLLLLVFLFTACEEEKEKSLNFEKYSVERSFNDCKQEENGDCSFISLNYPLATSETAAAERINKAVEKQIIQIVDYQDSDSIETPEGLAEAFIKNYAESAEEFPEYAIPWEASVFAEISLRTSNLISIKFDSQVFTGGAHGYSSITFLNFDPQTGKSYTSEDLFTTEFKKFAEDRFRSEQNIPKEEPINSSGMFFENDQFQLPENIGFTADHIVLHYNPYEIASFAQGSFRMEFSYDEVRDYLKIDLNLESEKEVQALLQNP